MAFVINQDAMSELQATIELSVELNKFYNIDLFQRGFYQIRTSLKTPPKWPARIEVSLNKPKSELSKIGRAQTTTSTIVNNVAISRTFQILYRNEDMNINDAILYRIHTLIDSTRLEESLECLDLQLLVELWFGEEDEGTEGADKLESCSQRTLQLHFSPTKGLHHHLPVLFDYFHLSALEMTIHSALIAIHQPYLNMPRSQKSSWASQSSEQSTLEAVYFGQRPLSGLPGGSMNSRMQHAHVMHKRICTLLLSAHESLQQNLALHLTKLRGVTLKLEQKDCHSRLGDVITRLQNLDDEDDLIQTAITDITQLCAENVILWTQFLEAVTLQLELQRYLAKEHHSARVRRFAEAFFTLENPKNASLLCYDPGIQGHGALASIVRNSAYFQQLQPLTVECTELDGDMTSLPIIFEDIFFDGQPADAKISQDATKLPTEGSNLDVVDSLRPKSESFSSSSSQSQNGDPVMTRQKSRSKKNFIKNIKPESFKRPSSYSCSEVEKLETQKPLGKTESKEDSAVLIGYRKIPKPDTEPSKAVFLGTLTPVPSGNEMSDSAGYQLRPATSTSSILSRPCWSRVSTTSLPELVDLSTCRDSYATPIKPPQCHECEMEVEEEIRLDITNNTFESDKDLSQKRAVFKAHRSYTAPTEPLVDDANVTDLSASTAEIMCLDGKLPLTDKSSSACKHGASVSRRTLAWTESKTSASPIEGLQGTVDKDTAEGSSHFLSQGSNPATLHVTSSGDDLSEDDTYIANGYYNAGESETLSISEDSGIKVSSTAQLSNCDSSEFPAPGSGLTDADTDTSISPCLFSDGRTDDSARVSSQDELCGQGLTSGSSKTSVLPTDHSDGKVTVIELLREEYELSQQDIGAVRCVMDNGSGPYQRASSDTNIARSLENTGLSQQRASEIVFRHPTSKCSGHKEKARLSSSSSYPDFSRWLEMSERPRLVAPVGHSTVKYGFVKLRESLRLSLNYPGHIYSEFSTLASSMPYFQTPDHFDDDGGMHLIVCVHGLDGNSADLRLVRTYIEMALPGYRLEFLMSERNQQDTFADFESMTDKLVDEILFNMDIYSSQVTRISFVGHSLGNIIIRSALTSPKLTYLLPKMYTFLSLSGPHLGALYNNSGLVNMGMWFMQKWKKSGSLLQLSLKDASHPRQSFLYKLSQKQVLQHFRHVLLVGSCQDRYVPYHSSRIEVCKAAQKDNSIYGKVYQEMVENILRPIINTPTCKLIRYDVFHALPSTANTIIGRAAHIAVLDSEVFIEKFMLVTGLKFFK